MTIHRFHTPPNRTHISTIQMDHCYIWTALPSAATDEETTISALQIISNEERKRAERFRFEADFLAFVAAHALQRQALSVFADISPKEWQFDTGPHGRPFISPEMNPQDLRFNISHTRTLVACVVTRGIDCGIDVETIGRSKQPLNLARHNFTNQEIIALEQCSEDERDKLFCAIWCLKEAYFKAEGVGLTVPMDRISFDVDVGSNTCTGYQIEKPITQSQWLFELFRPSDTHFGAIAVPKIQAK